MKVNTNDIISKYLQDIRHCLPIYRNSEKQYISDIQLAIEDYAESAGTLSHDMLVAEFGSPEDLASNYISEQDISSIQKAIKFSKMIKISILASILIIVTFLGVQGYAAHQQIQDADNTYINREVIVIDEMEE